MTERLGNMGTIIGAGGACVEWAGVVDTAREGPYDSALFFAASVHLRREVLMKIPFRSCAALALIAFVCSTALHAQDKKRIAVLDFDYQTVHSSVYDLFGGDVDIGQGVATMLVTELVKNGTYSVIERQ